MAEFDPHLLRPLWLAASVPLWFLYRWLRQHRSTTSDRWRQRVAPELQPHVLSESEGAASALPLKALLAAWMIMVVLLAGPVWHSKALPAGDIRRAEVWVQDISVSMTLEDVSPSRMSLAGFRLRDLLASAAELRVGLIGFAERPYVISPLTDDTATIENFLPSLDPAIAPVQGSRLDLAIAEAARLLEQAGVFAGHIVLITDAEVSAADLAAADTARATGHRVSVMAVGSERAEPMRRSDGRFMLDSEGHPLSAQLDSDGLRELARRGGGVYADAREGDVAIARLIAARESVSLQSSADTATQAEDSFGNNAPFPGAPDQPASSPSRTLQNWVEYAPYALPALLVWALLLFRRRADVSTGAT